MKFVKTILVLASIGVFAFALWQPLRDVAMRVQSTYFPCRNPITYSIGSFDKRFGISRQEFLSAIVKGEKVWEMAAGKELFSYASSGGDVTVNLIFDSRQESTIKLQQSGLVIKDDQKSYDALRAKYDALRAVYTKDIAALEARITAFKINQNTYNKEVAYWNKRRGAPADVYAKLTEEQSALNAEADAINKMESDININVADINSLADALTRIATALNMKVDEFNRIGRQGEEFEEGTYRSGPTGQEIDIYQFNDTGKLLRVLAHELGHALGLDHLENPKAIMYRLNSGVNEKLTADDIAALKARCKLQ